MIDENKIAEYRKFRKSFPESEFGNDSIDEFMDMLEKLWKVARAAEQYIKPDLAPISDRRLQALRDAIADLSKEEKWK